MTQSIKMASWWGSCNSPLYFTVVLLLHIASAAADVIVTFDGNITDNFLSMPSNFGHAIPEFGLTGLLYIAEPLDGCKPIERAPSIVNGTRIPDLQFALIRRGNCQFDEKVLQAQEAGFNAAIVYNDNSNGILPMTGSEYAPYVSISSVFVGIDDGLILRGYDYSTGRYITITRGTSLPWGYYLYPFITVLTTCFIFSCFYGVTKFIRDRRRLRRIRLSRDHLKKLPIIKFKKGDDRYDCCAICLDDYEEGNKLRVLPCNHAFHCKCIDPWLTNSRRTCPICKRKVVPPGVPDSDQESSDDDDSSVDENTPLLGGASGPSPRSPTAPPEVMMWGAVGGSDREVVLDPPMSPPAVCESYDSGIANNSHAEDNNLELAPPSDRDQEEEEQEVDRPIDQSLDHLLDVAIDVEGPNNTAPIV